MTVGEAIEILQTFPKDTEMLVEDNESGDIDTIKKFALRESVEVEWKGSGKYVPEQVWTDSYKATQDTRYKILEETRKNVLEVVFL